MITPPWIFSRMRNFSDKLCIENQNTHSISNNVFRKSCRLWMNVEKYDTTRQTTHDDIIRRMRLACRVTNVTNIHSEYVTIIVFRRQNMVTRTLLNITFVCSLLILFIYAWWIYIINTLLLKVRNHQLHCYQLTIKSKIYIRNRQSFNISYNSPKIAQRDWRKSQ
jgi:hypothetical protein